MKCGIKALQQIRCVRLMDDEHFIDRLEHFVYLYENNLGWYPVVSFTNGTKSQFGAAIFYRKKPLSLSLKAAWRNAVLYNTRLRFSRSHLQGNILWKFGLTGRLRNRDDLEYYGLGAYPEKDSRNRFHGEQKSGVYQQKIQRLLFVTGMRPDSHWQFFYTSYIEKRQLGNPAANQSTNLDQVFAPGSIPGVWHGAGSANRQFYNELAGYFDTRKKHDRISPGWHVESYIGLSTGVAADRSRFLRAGGACAFYLPVIKNNRLIVPKIAFNMIENLQENTPVSFAYYPKHRSFRGVSGRTLLRTDKYSFVPSLEYQWPLSSILNGYMFLDYLLVADDLQKLSFNQAPYIYGLGINLKDGTRFFVGTGSEGIRITVKIGLSSRSDDRTRWQ